MVGLDTEHLFGTLEFAWAGPDAQALEQRDIALGVGPAVAVSTSQGDATLPFQNPKVMRRNS